VISRHLVLAGAGHAQLDLLSALSAGVPSGWKVSVVTPQPAFHYSGMLPAVIAGNVSPAAADILVAAIARAAGVEVHIAPVVALDAHARKLTLGGGTTLTYDLLSLDVGSVPAGLDAVPGARAHAFVMKPFASALQLMAHLDAVCSKSDAPPPVPVVVVGAGAAGVEIALALNVRIARAHRTSQITLVDPEARDGAPLPGFAPRVRRLAQRVLQRNGIRILGGAVTSVAADRVGVSVRRESVELPTVATVWVSGAASHPWLAESGLSCDERGYPYASALLSLKSDDSVFGGGDCITLSSAPTTPKAGVFAVRMAPVLADNVLRVMRGEQPAAEFIPQRNFLALLSTGTGSAILRWNAVTFESRAAQWLKDRIDSAYLNRYRAPPTSGESIPPPVGLP